MRAYDAAMTNNLNADFMVSTSSANAEILTSINVSRNRARKLCRDNQYAKGILRTYKNNVVGDDPFRLEMKVGKRDAKGKFVEETETNRKIEEAWKEAGLPKNCTVQQDMSRMELYHMVYAAAKRDGGVLARHHRDYPFNKFGYALRILESDRLQESYMGRSTAGNTIRFSIERDQWDRPIFYWILTRHPGDVFGYNSGRASSREIYGSAAAVFREQVKAEDIIHFNNLRDRAEQDIGMTEFDTIIQSLHRIEQFDISHVTAAIWASCKPFFILQKFPTGLEYIGEGLKRAMDEAVDQTGEKTVAVEPATGETLPPGHEPFLVDPKFPIESGPEFKKEQLRGVASGAGIAYHALANDLSDVNFSSARFGEGAQRDNFKVDQKHMVLNFVLPHFAAWLKNAILSGALDLPISRYEEFVNAAHFNPKRWPYIQPVQDAQADILRTQHGLDSRSHIIAESERGGDVEMVDAEIASDQAVDEAHGLDFSGDPTEPAAPGDDGEDVPPAPSKTGGKQTLRSRRQTNFAQNGH